MVQSPARRQLNVGLFAVLVIHIHPTQAVDILSGFFLSKQSIYPNMQGKQCSEVICFDLFFFVCTRVFQTVNLKCSKLREWKQTQ